MNPKKCAFEQSQEIQAGVTTAHQNLLGCSNQISTGKYSQIDVEFTCQQFLDQIPKIELLVTTFRNEIENGRLKEKNGN